MMKLFRIASFAAIAAALVLPQEAFAKSGDRKRGTRIVVYAKPTPKYRGGPSGFLPGYRQPLPIGEWRDRAPRFGGGDFSRDRRYINMYTGRVSYGWGSPRFYRGQWNGGSFGPCYTRTPIGPMWNCGM
jgi:hypothetical protein